VDAVQSTDEAQLKIRSGLPSPRLNRQAGKEKNQNSEIHFHDFLLFSLPYNASFHVQHITVPMGNVGFEMTRFRQESRVKRCTGKINGGFSHVKESILKDIF
jgi:hypothetical protein